MSEGESDRDVDEDEVDGNNDQDEDRTTMKRRSLRERLTQDGGYVSTRPFMQIKPTFSRRGSRSNSPRRSISRSPRRSSVGDASPSPIDKDRMSSVGDNVNIGAGG